MSKRGCKSSMLMIRHILVSFFVCTFLLLSSADSRSHSYDPKYLSRLVKDLSPSVVNISTTSITKQRNFGFGSPWEDPSSPFHEFFKRFFEDNEQGREFKRKGLGSGFIISSDGYIITNHHVVKQVDEIDVILENGKNYRAKIIGTDPKTDLALLKIDPEGSLKSVKIGDSSKLEIGDWVVAIGNPFGLGNTITAGIVSAKGRTLGFGAYDDFIQTDAAINPGNSGGPLFNHKGEVVGVNTAIIARGEGIGFAIPINIASRIADQLKDSGKVVRGWLGVYIQKISPEIRESLDIPGDSGVIISDVAPGSPAESAGIQRGDAILQVNEEKIKTVNDLPRIIANTSPGTVVSLNIVRSGKRKNVKVKLGEFPEEQFANPGLEGRKVEAVLGMAVTDITSQLMQRYKIEKQQGVLVSQVQTRSTADNVGLKRGDVILEVNQKKIDSVKEFREELSRLKDNSNLLLLVRRPDSVFYVVLKYKS